jgi:hypothetical protein
MKSVEVTDSPERMDRDPPSSKFMKMISVL